MKILTTIIGLIAILGGIAFGVLAYLEPGKYDMTAASAIQATQVYAMAQYYASLSIICLLVAIAVMLSTAGSSRES